jgi:cellulose synthase operon protein C
MSSFVVLQRRRVKFAELGPQLEKFAPRVEPLHRRGVLLAAAAAYRSAGDSDNELRVLTTVSPNYFAGDEQERFLELLLAKQPGQLVQLASSWTPVGEQAADFTVSHGDAALVHEMIAARAHARPPVWSKAYSALAGLYLAESSLAINAEFLAVLGDQTIGERLGKGVDRDSRLAGDIWFYYGSRYGEYLGDAKFKGTVAADPDAAQGDATHANAAPTPDTTQGAPEDFLPSGLEQSPASSSGYQILADYYAERGEYSSAIADYQHALDLSPEQAGLHDLLAQAYYRDGKGAEAIVEWKLLFSTLSHQVNTVRLTESFWSDFAHACEHVGSRKLFADVRPEADSVVQAYLRYNGSYRSEEILRSVYKAFGDPAQATAWLLDVSSSASDSIAVLADVVGKPWIPLAQSGPIYQRILEQRQNILAKSDGLEKANAENQLRSWQIRWIEFLVDTKQFRQAADYLSPRLGGARSPDAPPCVDSQLRVAAELGTLDALLTGYAADKDDAPSAETLKNAAQRLVAAGKKRSARKILEFVFAREIENHQLAAANFLGLAEIRIAVGDTPGALELLHRMVNVVGDTYLNMDSSAALLEKTGHNAEALAFLEPLAKSTPWDPSLRLRLARAQIAAGAKTGEPQGLLTTIVAAAQAPYGLRVAAALVLSGSRSAIGTGSAELQLLSRDSKAITLAAADQPFFYAARLGAAQNASDARQKLQILSQALGDAPAREDARVPLFHAAAALHADEFALAAIEELRDQRIGRAASVSDNNEEQAANIGESSDQEEAEQHQRALYANTASGLPAQEMSATQEISPVQQAAATQQARLAHAVGMVLLRLDRLSEALGYLQAAKRLEKNPGRRKQLAAEIREVQRGLQLQHFNAARQPILHADLGQDRLVRPKLSASGVLPIDFNADAGENP